MTGRFSEKVRITQSAQMIEVRLAGDRQIHERVIIRYPGPIT